MQSHGNIQPSKFWLRFFRWFCRAEYKEDIEGDLLERFEVNAENHGIQKAKRIFKKDVLKLFRPSMIRKLEGNQKLNNYGMFKNFITTSIRSIKKQKLFSSINILGLSVGIAVSIMLFSFIQHELSYDGFHEKGDRIFKVISRSTSNDGNTSSTGISFGSVAPEIKKAIPEVEDATRIYNAGLIDVVQGITSFQGQRLYYTDKAFFDIFSFRSLFTSKSINKTAYDNHGMVINETLAATIFGTTSPIGETLKLDGKEYTILDVVQVPKKSHLQFDIAISLENMEDLYDWSYHSGLEFHSYGLYAKNTDHRLVDEKISKLYNEQMDSRFSDFIASSDNFIQPFKDIYLKSENISNNLTTGSINTIYIISIINVLILFIAVANYINLTTAQYEKRIKEIGIRKVIGANRGALIFQFLGESVILTLISFAVALFLAQLLIHPFGELMQIPASITLWQNPSLFALMVLAACLLGLISGLSPALFISRFNPIKILKRDFVGFRKGTKGSKVLVTFQFIIAIVLITNLVFLNKQIDFVKNKELGFSKDQILVVNNLTEKQKAAYKTIIEEIRTSPQVIEITGAQAALGQGTSGQTAYLKGENSKSSQPIGEIRTMHNFINTYDIKLIKGRDFSEDLVTDKDAFIINKSGEQMLFPGGEDAIGKVVVIGGREGPIIGVVEDFHYSNLKRQINPLVLSLDAPYRVTLSIKLNPENIKAALNHIEGVLQKADSEYQLGYYFLDDYFETMFLADERNASLISYSSFVATIISLVGLIALISHGLAKRMKEVAIRKVLGAHLKQLVWVLTKEFYLIILLANIIAIPITVMVLNSWLSSFSYRIALDDNWIVFVLVTLFSVIITTALVLTQVIGRTKVNPTEILSNE